MSKFATKAAANMFCQARYEAAKSNERLSSREGAAEEIGIDRTRLARIELGSTIPYQEEVLLMADCYKAPELKGNYCREMCPLGKNMPKMWSISLVIVLDGTDIPASKHVKHFRQYRAIARRYR